MASRPDVVDDIMTSQVISIDEDSTVRQAEELVKERGVRKLIVTRSNKPLYVLEEWRLWGRNKEQKIKEFAEELAPAYTVQSGTLVDDVRKQLEDRPAVVVMDKEGRQMAGVLTATDIVKLMEKRIRQRPWEQRPWQQSRRY